MRKSFFVVSTCLISAVVGDWQASAQTKIAALVVTSRSLSLHPALGTDPTLGAVTTYFTTFDGSTTTFPLNQQLGGGLIGFSSELRPRRGSVGVYEADAAVLNNSVSRFIRYGSLVITLPTTDTDQNGLPDFTEISKAASVTGTLVLQLDWPASGTGNLQIALTRGAGASLGNAHISTTTPGAMVGTPDVAWEVISFSGNFGYTRGAPNFTTINLSRTTSQVNSSPLPISFSLKTSLSHAASDQSPPDWFRNLTMALSPSIASTRPTNASST